MTTDTSRLYQTPSWREWNDGRAAAGLLPDPMTPPNERDERWPFDGYKSREEWAVAQLFGGKR